MEDSEADKVVFDVYPTVMEIIITLSSATILGLITFFSSVLKTGVPRSVIQIAIVLMAIAIITGLLSLMRMSGLLAGGRHGDREFNSGSAAAYVLYDDTARYSAFISALSYFGGLAVLSFSVFR